MTNEKRMQAFTAGWIFAGSFFCVTEPLRGLGYLPDYGLNSPWALLAAPGGFVLFWWYWRQSK